MNDQVDKPRQTFDIVRVYLKDVSFESPMVPSLFSDAGQVRPEVSVQLNAESHPQGEGLYEVVLAVTVTATQDEKTVWLAEVKQAGLFKLGGFENDALGQVLGSFCPNTLFPFAREAVADLVVKGGLPAIYLAPINFDALYAQHLAKVRESAPAPETSQ